MSHAVTVTRTVTTTNTTAIVLNTGYLKTGAGVLKLLQLVLGGISVGIILSKRHDSYLYDVPDLFFLLMATTFFICTACLLISCIVSLSTGGLISKTIFEFIYHLVAAILLLTASVLFFIQLDKFRGLRGYQLRAYDWFVAATIIGAINSIMYFLSTLLACRSYKGY